MVMYPNGVTGGKSREEQLLRKDRLDSVLITDKRSLSARLI